MGAQLIVRRMTPCLAASGALIDGDRREVKPKWTGLERAAGRHRRRCEQAIAQIGKEQIGKELMSRCPILGIAPALSSHTCGAGASAPGSAGRRLRWARAAPDGEEDPWLQPWPTITSKGNFAPES